MKPSCVPILLCIFFAASCSATTSATPSWTPTAAPLPTAVPIVATPPPGPTIALHAYMKPVHESVLLEFGRRVAANRELLSGASSRSFDADMLCPGPESGSWQHFDDLMLELSVLVVPPLAEDFHAALAEALVAAERSAESYEWFCATYASFGQPADGMWARLSAQVRACESRVADLHEQWEVMGGEQMGLVW